MGFKNLIDCCDHWLEQYHDAYRVMNRICSSHKGNRYSFQVITKVNREEDINGEESFFPRGGHWRYTGYVGLCGLYDNNGDAYDACGFRSVLVVE